jgi:hypothetical protein
MWSSLLGLSLLIALNPLLLGIILLIISRPRPVQNLLAYWVGTLLVNLPLFLTPLTLLHVAPGFESFARGFAAATAGTGSGINLSALIPGGAVLLIVAVVAVRGRSRRTPAESTVSAGSQRSAQSGRADAAGDASTSVSDTSTLVLDASAKNRKSGSLGRVREAISRIATSIRHVFGRLSAAWEHGSLWVSLIFGMFYLPSLTLVLLVDISIVTSGAGIGEQIGAALVFVFGFLAVLELTLLSYAVAPGKTEVVLRPLHAWARAHNRQIMLTFFALVGVWQVARGFGLAA